TRKAIPPSRIPCHHGTWASAIWPYLEEGTVAQNWDKEKSYYFQPLENIQTQVGVYLCPTRRSPPQLSVGGDYRGSVAHRAGALSDYAVSLGDGHEYQADAYDPLDVFSDSSDPKAPNGAFIAATATCVGIQPDIRILGGYKERRKFGQIVDG